MLQLVQALKYENFEDIDENLVLNSDQIGVNDEVMAQVSFIQFEALSLVTETHSFLAD